MVRPWSERVRRTGQQSDRAALRRPGLRPGPGQTPDQALVAALAGRSPLLVLDNAEHVLDGVAALITQLRQAAPQARWLITSQEALHLADEHVFRVGALALPTSDTQHRSAEEAGADDDSNSDGGAVALFAARAQAADRHFVLSPDKRALVVDICRRLDGNPLAIELAAARLPMLGVQGLHDRLDQRLKVLTSGDRAAARRHHTLRAALEWSHQLLAPPEQARYYRDVLSPDSKVASAAVDWLWEHEPRHASMARTSVSPNIFTGGYRSNVIPSEARARIDVRMVPGEDAPALLEQIRRAINDPAVDVQFAGGGTGRPAIAAQRIDSELFRAVEAAVTAVYHVPTLPSMSTYATDMWQLRARGMQCVGIGAAVDIEDQTRGFGMHSDQERLLESELHRFVRFNWEIVTDLARAR